MQYKESDNGDGRVISLPLGMHNEPQHLENNYLMCFDGSFLDYIILQNSIKKFCL